MVVLLLVLVASWLAGSAPEAGPCEASLPRGPAVPAPVVLRTSCGGFRLAPDGQVSRLPPRWFAMRQGGTGRRYGADINIGRTRPGRFILLRRGRTLWRSSRLYHNDGGDIAFGPNAFAFASYRRGIFVTDLQGPERLIMRGVGLFPLAFLRNGSLLVNRNGTVAVVSQDGSLLRRYRYRARNGFAFDQQTETLYFVTPGRMLARATGTNVTVLRPLRDLEGWIYLVGRDLLAFSQDRRAIAVTRRDGRLVARASWRAARDGILDAGLVASSDNRTFAFRLTKRSPGRTTMGGTAVIHVLGAGAEQGRAIYRHRLGDSGCAVGASLSWHGTSLLYSSTDGHLAVLNTRDGRALPLTALATALSRRVPGGQPRASAYWAGDFPRPRVPR